MRPAFVFAAILSLVCVPALADVLTVAVAANLQFAFADLQTEFKKQSGHELRPIYSSSGKLAAQIMNGAPFDVFLSADMEYPERVYQEGFAATAPKPYAYGTLVLWTLKSLDLKEWQKLLVSPTIGRIALPNPGTAPYGREAIKVLHYFKIDRTVQSKLVYGESIAQTNQYIHSRVADIGFTAKSVVLAPDMKGVGTWIELPRNSYQPIAQGAVILKHGKQAVPAAAQQFYGFIYSQKARAILERYGYLLP